MPADNMLKPYQLHQQKRKEVAGSGLGNVVAVINEEVCEDVRRSGVKRYHQVRRGSTSLKPTGWL